jgi:hypothetical protein
MNKRVNIGRWLIAILFLFGFYVYYVFVAAKRLVYSVGVPEKISISKGSVLFTMIVNVTNADNVGFRVNSVNIANFFNRTEVGRCFLEEPVTISAKSTTELPVRVIIPISDLIFLIPAIKTSIQAKKVNFKFDGVINAAGFTVPMELNYSVDFKNII